MLIGGLGDYRTGHKKESTLLYMLNCNAKHTLLYNASKKHLTINLFYAKLYIDNNNNNKYYRSTDLLQKSYVVMSM